MIKILAIGNSFSEDATTYLHSFAEHGGVECKTVNLYIGGCSLERHWNNICEDKVEYDYQLNGQSTGKLVGIHKVLTEEKWDIVTMQQCSGYSGILDSYYPYIVNLSNYIRQHAPGATQLIHQTWAYELDSAHEHFAFYHHSQEEMYEKLVKCYDTVAKELSLGLIPSGEVVQELRKLPPFDYKNGGRSLCRDGFHMDYVYGRYALAATWYEYVMKKDILNNDYVPPIADGVIVEVDKLEVIKQCVHSVILNHSLDRNK